MLHEAKKKTILVFDEVIVEGESELYSEAAFWVLLGKLLIKFNYAPSPIDP